MPTQIPSINQYQQLQETLTEIVKQGLTGVLILVGITGVIISAAIFLIAWSRRNQKPIDTTAGTNAAINAFAEMINSQNKQIEDDRELKKAENELNRQQIRELNERYIESISAGADATNRLADNLDRFTVQYNTNSLQEMTDISMIKDTVNRIESTMGQIVNKLLPTTNDSHLKEIKDFQQALADLWKIVSVITNNMPHTDKRSTGSLVPVPSDSHEDQM